MFEKEIDRVRKQLRQHLDSRNTHIPLQSILSHASVDSAYRAFFTAEVDWWLHEEAAMRMSNPRFDTSAPGFSAVFSQLDTLNRAHARFDHEELSATIDAAVKTRLNFLCRPRTTLKWFVFRGEPTKTMQEVLLRLRYLTDHRYLIQGIEQWANSRLPDGGVLEILSVVEFERMVEKIDNDAILDLSQHEFVQLLDGLFDFFASADPDLPPESVPTEAVIIFLDDKGAIPISQALERLLYREELRTLTRAKLIDVINSVIAGIEGPPPAAAPPPPPASPLEPAELEVLEPKVEVPSPASDQASAVRMDKFQALLDSGTRERIIRKVFGKDTASFETFVADILNHDQWKGAAGTVDRFLAQRGVAPDSASAMELTQALHRSFL